MDDHGNTAGAPGIQPESAEAAEKGSMSNIEETACDEIASIWVRGGRNLIQFRQHFDEIVSLFDFTHRRGTKNIYLLDLVDTWEEDYGLAVEDFEDLRFEIEGWIVTHMSAFGRIKR